MMVICFTSDKAECFCPVCDWDVAEDEEELLELLISECDESESAKVAENIIVYDDENLE